MNPFSQSLKLSLAVHAAVCGMLCITPLFNGCLSSKAEDTPMFDLVLGDGFFEPQEEEPVVENVVADPPPLPQAEPELPPPPPPPKEVLKEPEPIVNDEADKLIEKKEPEKKPDPKPEVKPDPKPVEKKPIKVSEKVVTRQVTPPPTPKPPVEKPKTPSFADTRTPVDPKAVPGAKSIGTPTPGNPTLTATENQRIIAAISNAMKIEWDKETISPLEMAGNPPPIVEITIAPNGRVTDAKITTSSGSKLYDEAALRAARRGTIPEVTLAFLKEKNNKVQVRFKFSNT